MKYFLLVLLCALFYSSCQTSYSTNNATGDNEVLKPKLDSVLNQVLNVYELPGLAVGIIKGNKVIYAKGFGLQKSGASGSINTKSLFHMASVSKPFVATAILQLVDKGKIALDSSLIQYIPYFKMKDPRYKKITIRQMLTHMSGFPDVGNYDWDKPQYDDKALERYIEDSVSTYRLQFEPGSQFAYSNMAYDVLAEVITQIAGMPFETYMENYIFKPCKMYNSTFLIKGIPPALSTSPHVFDSNCHFEVSRIYPYNRCHAGSSTLHSNIEDMLNWESMILNNGEFDNKQIISSESIKIMLSSQHKFDENSSDGLGVFIDTWNGKKLISHSGSDVGYSTYIGIIPQDSVAFVFMSNLHRFVPYDVITNILLNAAYNLPAPEFKKPINLIIAPIICEKGFNKAREKYLELKKDSSEKYDFDGHWINTLANAFAHSGELDNSRNVLSLNINSHPN
jgi:CubicO group peptidase (beta-lactamase class C family)